MGNPKPRVCVCALFNQIPEAGSWQQESCFHVGSDLIFSLSVLAMTLLNLLGTKPFSFQGE